MQTVANVKKVALIFFILLTGTHLTASLMLANEYFTKWSEIWVGTLDIPAIFSGILYAFTSLKLYLEETGRRTQIFDVVAGIIGGGLLIATVLLNFFL